MADGKTIIDALLSVVKAAAPVIGGAAPGVVELGKRIVELVDHTVDEFNGDNIPDDLIDLRDEIETRVNRQVDQTTARLRGG